MYSYVGFFISILIKCICSWGCILSQSDLKIYLTYTFTTQYGCVDSDSIFVEVGELLEAEAGPNQSICLNDNILELSGFSPIDNIVWSGNGIVNSQIGLFNPSISGTGIQTLTIQYGEGTCQSTDEVEIDVLELTI